jgi:hypothetical protein
MVQDVACRANLEKVKCCISSLELRVALLESYFSLRCVRSRSSSGLPDCLTEEAIPLPDVDPNLSQRRRGKKRESKKNGVFESQVAMPASVLVDQLVHSQVVKHLVDHDYTRNVLYPTQCQPINASKYHGYPILEEAKANKQKQASSRSEIVKVNHKARTHFGLDEEDVFYPENHDAPIEIYRNTIPKRKEGPKRRNSHTGLSHEKDGFVVPIKKRKSLSDGTLKEGTTGIPPHANHFDVRNLMILSEANCNEESFVKSIDDSFDETTKSILDYSAVASDF